MKKSTQPLDMLFQFISILAKFNKWVADFFGGRRVRMKKEKEDLSYGTFLVTIVEGIQIIAPETRDDTADGVGLSAAFAEAYAGPGPVLLELDAFESIPPQALLVIKRWALRLAAERRAFGVCTTSRMVKLALEGQNLGPSLIVFPSLSKAVQIIRPGARPPLGDILQKEFGLDRPALIKALQQQKSEGGLLGQILLVHRAIEPMALARALSLQDN